MRTISIIFILFFLPFFLQSKRGGSPFKNLQTSANTIQVYCYQSKSILVFDTNGHFMSEKQFQYNSKNISNSSFYPLPDGNDWVIDDDLTAKGSCSFKSASFKTRFHLFDKKCVLIATHTISGRWEGYLSIKSHCFIKTEKDKHIIIHGFNPKTGKYQLYFQVSYKALLDELKLKQIQLQGWAVDNAGRVVLLLEKGSTNGIVLICTSEGAFKNHWEVQPDPVTSVSYINGLHVDNEGNIYVTHSSWEVSSATQNFGSIAKFTPAGKMLMRIKQGIGYVDEISILPDESIVITQEWNNLARLSSAGHLMLSWIAVPPPPGITWQNRLRIMQKIPWMNAKTPIKELLQASQVCEYKDMDRIKKLCSQKGPEAIGPLTETLLDLSKTNDSGRIFGIAKTLWEKYPTRAVPYLEEKYKKVSYQDKKLFAVFLAKNGKNKLPDMKKILREIATSDGQWGMFEKVDAEEALKKIDPIAILAANLENARRNDLDWGIRNTIYEDFFNAFPLLEKIILNPADKLRPAIRWLIINAREENCGLFLHGKNGSEVLKKIINKISGWLKSEDPFVRDTAVMALTAFGVPGHQQTIIDLAKKSYNYIPLALIAFQGLGKKNIAWVEPWGTSLADIVIEFYKRKRIEGKSSAELLFSIKSVTAQERCLNALASKDTLTRSKKQILRGMALSNENILPQTWSTIKNNPQWFSINPEFISPYSRLLGDFIRRNPGQASKIHRIFIFLIEQIEKRQEFLASQHLDPRANNWCNGLKTVLEEMEAVVLPEDVRILERLMNKFWLGDEARYKLFPLLEKIGLPDSLIPQLKKYLEDDNFALAAARLLCTKGNEKALRILIDKGLKRSGSYSFQRFDAKLFQPFGKKGIAELIKLLDYPDDGPQMWARHLLASLKAPEFYPRLKKEYDAFIKTKTYHYRLNGELIGCMELYGYDTIPDITQIPIVKKGAIPNFFLENPIDFKVRLQKYILQETDNKKIEILLNVLSQNSENDEEEKILEDLAKKHPISNIRNLLKKKLKEKKE